MIRIVLAATSGLLYAFVFPEFDFWPLAWVFAVPLFFAVDCATGRESFVLGLTAGIVAWAGNLYWIAYVLNFYGDMSLLAAAFLLFLFVIYLSLYFAAFAFMANMFIRSRLALLVLPGMWVFFELIRSYALSGFPWSLAGCSQFAWKSLIQISEFGGVYLISGIILMTNVALYKLFCKNPKPLVIVLAVLVSCCLWGNWRINSWDLDGTTLNAAVVQANIAQERKWLPEMIEPTIEVYSRLTRSVFEQDVELVIWPETACNFYLFRQWQPTAKILRLSNETEALLLAGSPAYDEGKYYNRVWLLKSGTIEGYYDKVHLVPFSEYLPLAWLIEPIFGRLTNEVSDFSSAPELAPIGEIGVMVCFESVFPGISRSLCRKGAQYLVNVSNDAWFKTWATPEQHLRLSAFRTIENRRWLLRSVNHGISAIISPTGEIIKSIGLLEEGAIVAGMKKNSSQTFYTRRGAIIAWIWSLLAGIAALTIRWRSANA